MKDNVVCDIVQFREHWTKAQKKRADDLIIKWGLKVFSYPAVNVSLVGQGEDITAVFEQAIGGNIVPLLRDLIDGDGCLADLAERPKIPFAPKDWDTVYVGSRKSDKHFGKNVIPAKEWQIGTTKFIAPLYDYTDEDVKRELGDLWQDGADTGDLHICHNCLKGEQAWCPKEQQFIPSIQWDREANLAAFQTAYQS